MQQPAFEVLIALLGLPWVELGSDDSVCAVFHAPHNVACTFAVKSRAVGDGRKVLADFLGVVPDSHFSWKSQRISSRSVFSCQRKCQHHAYQHRAQRKRRFRIEVVVKAVVIRRWLEVRLGWVEQNLIGVCDTCPVAYRAEDRHDGCRGILAGLRCRPHVRRAP